MCQPEPRVCFEPDALRKRLEFGAVTPIGGTVDENLVRWGSQRWERAYEIELSEKPGHPLCRIERPIGSPPFNGSARFTRNDADSREGCDFVATILL